MSGHTLGKKLTIATVLKLLLLVLLWFCFVKGFRVQIDTESMAHHLYAPVNESTPHG